jgi:hypothetical protein
VPRVLGEREHRLDRERAARAPLGLEGVRTEHTSGRGARRGVLRPVQGDEPGAGAPAQRVGGAEQARGEPRLPRPDRLRRVGGREHGRQRLDGAAQVPRVAPRRQQRHARGGGLPRGGEVPGREREGGDRRAGERLQPRVALRPERRRRVDRFLARLVETTGVGQGERAADADEGEVAGIAERRGVRQRGIGVRHRLRHLAAPCVGLGHGVRQLRPRAQQRLPHATVPRRVVQRGRPLHGVEHQPEAGRDVERLVRRSHQAEERAQPVAEAHHGQAGGDRLVGVGQPCALRGLERLLQPAAPALPRHPDDPHPSQGPGDAHAEQRVGVRLRGPGEGVAHVVERAAQAGDNARALRAPQRWLDRLGQRGQPRRMPPPGAVLVGRPA